MSGRQIEQIQYGKLPVKGVNVIGLQLHCRYQKLERRKFPVEDGNVIGLQPHSLYQLVYCPGAFLEVPKAVLEMRVAPGSSSVCAISAASRAAVPKAFTNGFNGLANIISCTVSFDRQA